MARLPLILGAIAVVTTTLTAVNYFRFQSAHRLLEGRVAESSARATNLENDLATARQENETLTTGNRALRAEADGAKAKLTATEARVGQLERDLGDTKSVLSIYEGAARDLADDVAILRVELADSRATNASPEAVAAYKNTIAELERQLAAAGNGTATPKAAGASTAVFMSRPGRSTILTVGPENSFVVINFGSVRGAQPGQKLTVRREGQVVATVQLSDVRESFSVAQVLPETLSGALQKGDSAVLIR
ncbi:MAG: hypothetical protein EXS38_00455 [Opitutus sp.]|nr:hypothetical protein [Opitutus sp.]